MKKLVVLLAAVLAMAAVAGPATAGKKKKKPEPQTITFEEEGTMRAPAVGSIAFGGVTEMEFAYVHSCGSLPAMQGHDGHVVELPEEYRDGRATLAVSGGDASGQHDFNVYLYDGDCNLMEPYIEEGADPMGAIPAGAQWAVVNMVLGAQGSFKLTATTTVLP